MQLAEISFITDKVAAMTDFYRRLLGVVPVGAQRAWQFSLRTRRRYQTCEQLMQQGLMLEIPPQDFYWAALLISGIRTGIK